MWKIGNVMLSKNRISKSASIDLKMQATEQKLGLSKPNCIQLGKKLHASASAHTHMALQRSLLISVWEKIFREKIKPRRSGKENAQARLVIKNSEAHITDKQTTPWI